MEKEIEHFETFGKSNLQPTNSDPKKRTNETGSEWSSNIELRQQTVQQSTTAFDMALTITRN